MNAQINRFETYLRELGFKLHFDHNNVEVTLMSTNGSRAIEIFRGQHGVFSLVECIANVVTPEMISTDCSPRGYDLDTAKEHFYKLLNGNTVLEFEYSNIPHIALRMDGSIIGKKPYINSITTEDISRLIKVTKANAEQNQLTLSEDYSIQIFPINNALRAVRVNMPRQPQEIDI